MRRDWIPVTLAWASLVFQTILSTNNQQIEAALISDEQRREGYAARNYTWPIPDHYIRPNTPGFVRLIKNRIRQMEAVQSENPIEKYDGWKSVLGQGLVMPNFTQYGWAVSKAPLDLVREIQEALSDGFDRNYREGYDPAILGEHEAVMVDLPPGLIDKALNMLHPMLQAWAGIPLRTIKGYGLRLYRNTSQLLMHLDKIETHIISCIFHIDRSIDAKPWPLVIEDFEGTTQHVYLNMGDLFFYESAKCLHGRPFPLEGGWYTSLFLHYAPLHWLEEANHDWETQYAVPDHWEAVRPYDETSNNNPPRLVMVDTAMMEPGCLNQWCGSQPTAIWDGKTKPGIAISSHGVEQTLNLPENHETKKESDEL